MLPEVFFVYKLKSVNEISKRFTGESRETAERGLRGVNLKIMHVEFNPA
jgi:hypothetical protein